MPVDEATRHAVYEALKAVHGEGIAASMMEMLPPAGVPDLATKDDIALLRSEFDGLRTEFHGLRSEFDGLRTEFHGLRSEFDGLRTESEGKLAALESRLGERIERSAREQTQYFVRVMLVALPPLAAVAGALGGLAVRLG